MKKLLYIDTYSTGHLHEMFDASSLRMFCYMYDEVRYYANKDSIDNVEHLLGELPKNVKVSIINVVNIFKPIGKLRRFLKQIQSTLLCCWYIATTSKDADIVINYMTAIALYPINWVARITNRRVLVVCHSDIQEVLGHNKVSWLFKKSIHMFDNANVKIAKNLWFAVLSDAILDNVLPLMSTQVKGKMLAFDHTAIFDRIPMKSHVTSSKLILGYVGGLSPKKGGDVFLKIAKHYKNNSQIEFRIIGNTSGQRDKLNKAGVIIPDGVGDFFISRELMYDNICDLDYVLYCFPPEGYKYTASGTVFDAIDCERPILAIRNDYFSGLFNVCGDFGYLEDDYDKLVNRIDRLILNRDNGNWNMKKVKEYLRPESAAKRFSKSKWYNEAKLIWQ